jgi:hypothetical protein
VDDDVLAAASVDEQVELLGVLEHVGDRRQRRLGLVGVGPPHDNLALLRAGQRLPGQRLAPAARFGLHARGEVEQLAKRQAGQVAEAQ